MSPAPIPGYPSGHLYHPLSRADVTTPVPETPVARARRRPSRAAPLSALALVVVAGLVVWYLLSRPKLIFTNTLAAPIWLTVGPQRPTKLGPGQSQRFRISGGNSLVVEWNLVRPLSANQRPMGEELRGSAVLRAPQGTVQQRAAGRTGDADYFAPLITNATSGLLRATVNAGLEGAVDCGCAVRPGARRVFIGYYRLYRNSTVTAHDSNRRSATFRELGPRVTSSDGTIGLQFQAKDFR
jgi:hypothetical protein